MSRAQINLGFVMRKNPFVFFVFIFGLVCSYDCLSQVNEEDAQRYVKQKMASAKQVGSTYDVDVNGDLVLYDNACLLPVLAPKYPYAWVAKIRGSSSIHSIGCYKVDLSGKQIVIFAPNDNRETTVPFTNFGLDNNPKQQAATNPFAAFISAIANGANAGRATLNTPLDPALMQQHQSVINANQLQQMQRRGFTCTPSGNGSYYCRQ